MTIKYETAKPRAYILSAAVTAAAIALPVADGGWHNLAYFVVWGYAWLIAVVGFMALFTGPLDSMPKAPAVVIWFFDAARLFAIGWLAYYGEHLLAGLLLFGYFAAWIKKEQTRKAMDRGE